MWHYTEGITNYDPVWPNHGIRILPGPSSLWLDATGKRLPVPLFPGFDTLGTLEHIVRSGSEVVGVWRQPQQGVMVQAINHCSVKIFAAGEGSQCVGTAKCDLDECLLSSSWHAFTGMSITANDLCPEFLLQTPLV